MKITFVYSDLDDLKDISNQIIQINIELPDTALHLPDCEQRVLGVARLVSRLTHVGLHINCKELGLRSFPIHPSLNDGVRSITGSTRITILRFERWNGRRFEKRDMKIIAPVDCPVKNPSPQLLGTYLLRFQPAVPDEATTRYLGIVNELVENLLILLNTEPIVGSARMWEISGFNPNWQDNTLVSRLNKLISRGVRRSRTAEKEAERLKKHGEQQMENVPQAGAGRRPGAVPGVFMGVQMRSQLEIRFAAKLQELGIRWAYETERLGEEQYLVDFYLPDLRIWVEVKGTFEARDNYQLPAVALYLQNQRQEQLYVYTQTKAFRVSTDTFASMNHKDFWEILVSKVKSAKSDL